MKRLTALALAFAMLLLLFTGCAKTRQEGGSMHDSLRTKQAPDAPAATEPEPQKPATEKPPKNPTLRPEPPEPEEGAPVLEDYSRFEGIYKAPSEGWQTVVLEVRACGDILLLEYGAWEDGSLAYSWAEEFWPEESISEDGALTRVSGQYQGFSVTDGRAEYWSAAAPRTIALTDEGLVLQEGDIAYTYRRNDALPTIHSTFSEQQRALSGMPSAKLAGEWNYADPYTAAYLRLGEDGSLLSVVKERHRPAAVLQGAWALGSEEGELTVCAALIGDMEQAYELTFYDYPESEGIFLAYYGEELDLPCSDGIFFWLCEGEWTTGLPLRELSSTYYELLHEDGILDCGDDYYGYYSYRIAQFFVDFDSDALCEINDEIFTRFWTPAQTELERIGNGEPPNLDTISYFYTCYDGLEQLTLWTYSAYELPDIAVYCYDREQDAHLDTRGVLKRLGIREQDFLDAVREAARTCYENTYSNVQEAARQAYGYDERLAWTASDEAVNLDLPVVVTEYGTLAVIARIGSMVGAGYDYVTLYPFA